MAHPNLKQETISESIEMYLLRIALLRTGGEPVPIPALAQELSVSTVSANEMCRRLVDKGLIEYEPYRGVTLTAKAETLAQRVLRNRRLWEVFFVEKLGIEPAAADEIACRFEHVTPDELADRLATFLGHPTLDPQNQPIPYNDRPLPARSICSLAVLSVGTKGRIVGLKAGETVKNFLRQQGLTPGAVVDVLAVAADGGLLLQTAGRQLSLSKAVASTIDLTTDEFV